MDIQQPLELPDLDEETNSGIHPMNIAETYRDQIDRLLRTYYLIVRALATGDNWGLTDRGQPRLPREIIYMICSFAGFGLPDEEASPSAKHPVFVSSRDETRISKPWFSTKPFTRHALKNIVAAQIITHSHDQGWADYSDIGWRSWFSLRIIRPDEHRLTRSVDREREWKSHSNRIADYTTRRYRGLFFDSSHEVWAHLGEGDRLEVMVHSQFRGWENHAEQGTLLVFNRWNPSEEFLNIVCGAPVLSRTTGPHDLQPTESRIPYTLPPTDMCFAASAMFDSLQIQDGHILTAKLLRKGEWNNASFELNNCLGNLDGKFGWGLGGGSRHLRRT
ncbi:unnamed protein product [Rhizoctonia solani]|uniref:Cyanovirin-N domain-containing protein n=1 Tax=Rhizoctonia solani TaxID=456999 RepID=A0A8H3BD73_9AGAM|nr:unnamed protein product [Rhizoctonia solani]